MSWENNYSSVEEEYKRYNNNFNTNKNNNTQLNTLKSKIEGYNFSNKFNPITSINVNETPLSWNDVSVKKSSFDNYETNATGLSQKIQDQIETNIEEAREAAADKAAADKTSAITSWKTNYSTAEDEYDKYNTKFENNESDNDQLKPLKTQVDDYKFSNIFSNLVNLEENGIQLTWSDVKVKKSSFNKYEKNATDLSQKIQDQIETNGLLKDKQEWINKFKEYIQQYDIYSNKVKNQSTLEQVNSLKQNFLNNVYNTSIQLNAQETLNKENLNTNIDNLIREIQININNNNLINDWNDKLDDYQIEYDSYSKQTENQSTLDQVNNLKYKLDEIGNSLPTNVPGNNINKTKYDNLNENIINLISNIKKEIDLKKKRDEALSTWKSQYNVYAKDFNDINDNYNSRLNQNEINELYIKLNSLFTNVEGFNITSNENENLNLELKDNKNITDLITNINDLKINIEQNIKLDADQKRKIEWNTEYVKLNGKYDLYTQIYNNNKTKNTELNDLKNKTEKLNTDLNTFKTKSLNIESFKNKYIEHYQNIITEQDINKINDLITKNTKLMSNINNNISINNTNASNLSTWKSNLNTYIQQYNEYNNNFINNQDDLNTLNNLKNQIDLLNNNFMIIKNESLNLEISTQDNIDLDFLNSNIQNLINKVNTTIQNLSYLEEEISPIINLPDILPSEEDLLNYLSYQEEMNQEMNQEESSLLRMNDNILIQKNLSKMYKNRQMNYLNSIEEESSLLRMNNNKQMNYLNSIQTLDNQQTQSIEEEIYLPSSIEEEYYSLEEQKLNQIEVNKINEMKLLESKFNKNQNIINNIKKKNKVQRRIYNNNNVNVYVKNNSNKYKKIAHQNSKSKNINIKNKSSKNNLLEIFTQFFK